MNFLAHQHLSYPHQVEMVGNFMGDYVKGKKYLDYQEAISNGIMLHRKIDAFTDQHPATKACRQLFASSYGKYSGVMVDMVYDYALAVNWLQYANIPLEVFTQEVYANLFHHYDVLPPRVQSFLPKMKHADRLYSYSRAEGILYAIKLMTQYTSLPKKENEIHQIITQQSEEIFACFHAFYPDMQAYVLQVRERL